MTPTSLEDLIEKERPKNRQERAMKSLALLAPVLTSLAVLAVVWLFSGFAMVRALLGYALVSFFLLGKFLILKGIASGGLDPFQLAMLVFYMDLAVSFFFTFNLDYAYRFPYLGRRLEALQEHGREVLEERPWLRKITFLGIVLFVMFPLTGTGAIGGSLFGRLLGLGRGRTWMGIAIGSAVGCFGIAFLAEGIAKLVPEHLRASVWFEVAGLTVVVLLLLFLWLRSRRIERERQVRRAGAEGEERVR